MNKNLAKSQKMGHGIMVNFVMWAFAALAILTGAANIQYGRENGMSYLPLMLIVNVLMIAGAIYVIKVRFDLAALKPEAPGRALIGFIVLGVLALGNTWIEYITGEDMVGNSISTAFVFICTGIGIYRYYNEIVFPAMKQN